MKPIGMKNRKCLFMGLEAEIPKLTGKRTLFVGTKTVSAEILFAMIEKHRPEIVYFGAGDNQGINYKHISILTSIIARGMEVIIEITNDELKIIADVLKAVKGIINYSSSITWLITITNPAVLTFTDLLRVDRLQNCFLKIIYKDFLALVEPKRLITTINSNTLYATDKKIKI